MAKRKKTVKGGSFDFELPDFLTVNIIEEVVSNFKSKIGEKDNLTIKSAGVIKNIDMAGLQCLLYMKKYAEKKNKKINFSLRLDETVKDLLQSTGFNELTLELTR